MKAAWSMELQQSLKLIELKSPQDIIKFLV